MRALSLPPPLSHPRSLSHTRTPSLSLFLPLSLSHIHSLTPLSPSPPSNLHLCVLLAADAGAEESARSSWHLEHAVGVGGEVRDHVGCLLVQEHQLPQQLPLHLGRQRR
eukprot:494017-Rhodomonas_salina.1